MGDETITEESPISSIKGRMSDIPSGALQTQRLGGPVTRQSSGAGKDNEAKRGMYPEAKLMNGQPTRKYQGQPMGKDVLRSSLAMLDTMILAGSLTMEGCDRFLGGNSFNGTEKDGCAVQTASRKVADRQGEGRVQVEDDSPVRER